MIRILMQDRRTVWWVLYDRVSKVPEDDETSYEYWDDWTYKGPPIRVDVSMKDLDVLKAHVKNLPCVIGTCCSWYGDMASFVLSCFAYLDEMDIGRD